MIDLNGMRALMIGVAISGLTAGCVTSGKYAELDASYRQSQAELADASARIGSLEGDLVSAADRGSELQGSLSEKERALSEKERALAENTRALAALRASEAQAAQRISEFQELTNKFRALVDAGKLRVSVINGRMVVQMQTDVLFRLGRGRCGVG